MLYKEYKQNPRGCGNTPEARPKEDVSYSERCVLEGTIYGAPNCPPVAASAFCEAVVAHDLGVKPSAARTVFL
jgi:hypothetical protein